MAGIICGTLDVTDISEDNILVSNPGDGAGLAWLKADVDEKFYTIPGSPNPAVVVKFSDGCFANICTNNGQDTIMRSLLMWVNAIENINNPNAPNNLQNAQANTICGVDVNVLGIAQGAVDSSSINDRGFQAAAVIPIAVAIPMKSNVRTYGPYISSNFGDCGGTNAEVDPDLCPWTFGSTSIMNQAGQELANVGTIGLLRAETGGVTYVGLPDIPSIGYALSSGPNLTSVNVTFGSNGVTTNYDFKTYTPKFGQLSRMAIDRFKRISKNRQEQLKFLRSNMITQSKIARKIQAVQRDRARADGNIANQNSLARVLVGEIHSWAQLSEGSGQRTRVGLSTLKKSVLEMRQNYENKAYMSLDGLIGPVSINGDGGLPQFPSFAGLDHKVSPISPQPPFSVGELNEPLDTYNLDINQTYLNPLANPDTIPHTTNDSHAGHAIDIVGFGSEVPSAAGGIIHNFYEEDDQDKYPADYRFLGLRGPLIVHGWGYDLDGKPIPNAADVENDTTQGVFVNENLKDKFLKDWLQKPTTWPSAPVDLRFDRERGVWVCPQGYKIVVTKLKENLEPFSSAKGQLINENIDKNQSYGKKLFDADGNEVIATEEDNAQAFIKVVDRIGLSFTADTILYAYYDTFKCEYIALPRETVSIVKFALVQDKNITDREVDAILVDEHGYPTLKDGITPVEDQNQFNDNIITVRDPYHDNFNLPAPRGPGSIPTEISAFGPALGSSSLFEHVNGIELQDGYPGFYKKIGPFIGYALKRQISTETYTPGEGESVETTTIYEIITLEHFAKYVLGKIGTKSPIFNGLFLGARGGHRQGVVPVGRGHGNLPNNLNVILRNNISGFNGAHGFILGDIIDAPVGNGNILDDVDGCRFIAVLDNEVSTTTHLVYDMIECERTALACSWWVKDPDYADMLNRDFVQLDDETYIEATFLQGFMWDPTISSDNYRSTYLQNSGADKNDLNTAEIIIGARGSALLTGITVDGELVYTINTKSEIANIAQRYNFSNNPGLFGCPDLNDPADRKISDSDDFWDGHRPLGLPDANKPNIEMSDDQQWMTYDQGIITASWDEYGSNDGSISECSYKIIYAQEAPVIMTCIAASEFTPLEAQGVNLENALANILPSCQGADREPISSILQGNVFNPMGFGALIGDLVTIQRVYVGSDMSVVAGGHPPANYKYIVIGTGKLVE